MLLAGTMLGLLAAAYRYRVAHLLREERLRLRIASDLHDDIGSKLSSIALLSEMVTQRAALEASEHGQLTEITDLARQMVDDLREIVWMVNPRYDRLDNLVAKMQHLAGTLLKDARHTFQAVPETFSDTLDMERRRHFYLMYKEVLHNVARHAQASHVAIRVAQSDDQLVIEVRDDGVGFTPETTSAGSGLENLYERARQLDGHVVIESRPGAGTTVRITAKIPKSRDGRQPAGSL